MKKLLLLCSFFGALTLTTAQTNNSNTGFVGNNAQALSTAGNSNVQQHGTASYFTNPKREVKGSYHLLEKWDNRAVMITLDGSKYRVNNVNVNLKSQTFESRFKKDSLFTYGFNTLDRFIINNKVYKNFFYNEDNRIYEIVHESPKFSILKGFNLELIEGSANPMLNRKDDKYIQKQYHYIKTDSEIKKFKMKKKKVLKLISGDQTVKDAIEAYAKKNNYSFRKSHDVHKILEYADTL